MKTDGIRDNWSRSTTERKERDGSKTLGSTAEHTKVDSQTALARQRKSSARYDRAFRMACEMKGIIVEESSGFQAVKGRL